MASTWKDAASVFYWLNAIGREYNFPFPKDEEKRKEMSKELYPEIIAQAVHADFRKEMEEYLEFGAFGNIRFRFDEYYTFKKESKSFFLDWTLRNHALGQYPQQSYFIMHRTIDEINIKEQYGKLVFTMKDNNDRYPVVIRLSKKQLFLLKPFLEHNNIDTSILNRSYDDIAKELEGLDYYVLKYINSYDSEREKIVYWTYSTIAATAQSLVESFTQSVQGQFLPSFHPDEIPSPKIEQNRSAQRHHRQEQIRTNGKGILNIHTYKQNTVLEIKGEMIGFVHQKEFEWMGKPRPDLIPFIEQAFTSRKKAS
ncbi:MAG: hypothetical protein CL916_14315 [Deltaproteobacteria bacterium]|nr:hypothetical protein [Deltaproteobacteria bacterium]